MMIYLIVIAVLIVACKYFYDNYKLTLHYVSKLRLECENYLKVLVIEELIPEQLFNEKIEQMNRLYGKVALKVK